MGDLYKILLLGEGNFSFSLSLLKRMRVLSLKYRILATSFDSRDQVLTKYPDSLHSLNDMGKDADFEVRHDVDATSLSTCGFKPQTDRFSDIIFNFPHLGREDCNAHSSMLAHIFYSCIPYLITGGTISITLAESQGNLWKIHDMAARNNLELMSELEFRAHEWPGYVLMRHHVGKSFGGRVQRCLHYYFRLKSSETPASHQSILQVLSNTSYLVSQSIPVSVVQPVATTTSVSKTKRKKLDVLVEGHYHRIKFDETTPLVNANALNRFDVVTGEGWQCDFCERVLATEQGVKTHVYCTHIIADNDKESTLRTVEGGVASADMPSSSCSSSGVTVVGGKQCPHCEKIVANGDALMQHIRAKHGLFSDVKPAWAQAVLKESSTSGTGNTSESGVSNAILSSTCTCSVCGLQFSSESELTLHRKSGFLPQGVELSHLCSGCGKTFSDERGLKQHMNFCLSSSSTV